MNTVAHPASAAPAALQYEVIDAKTKARIGKPTTSRKAAYRRADRIDAAYGAVCCFVRSF